MLKFWGQGEKSDPRLEVGSCDMQRQGAYTMLISDDHESISSRHGCLSTSIRTEFCIEVFVVNAVVG